LKEKIDFFRMVHSLKVHMGIKIYIPYIFISLLVHKEQHITSSSKSEDDISMCFLDNIETLNLIVVASVSKSFNKTYSLNFKKF